MMARAITHYTQEPLLRGYATSEVEESSEDRETRRGEGAVENNHWYQNDEDLSFAHSCCCHPALFIVLQFFGICALLGKQTLINTLGYLLEADIVSMCDVPEELHATKTLSLSFLSCYLLSILTMLNLVVSTEITK